MNHYALLRRLPMAKKILVIDDDRMVTKTLEKLLNLEGFHVIVAESGKAALAIIQNDTVDLVISDIRMPDMDGVETIKAINGHLNKINKEAPPFIFITGYAGSEINTSAQKLKPTELLYKPFDKEEFLKTIRLALRK